ncbi:hypothetical protein HZS_6016 [Henneguya salminicola]|nr:hypothetical protein HZS_6016 [Henneguya salminicola]
MAGLFMLVNQSDNLNISVGIFLNLWLIYGLLISCFYSFYFEILSKMSKLINYSSDMKLFDFFFLTKSISNSVTLIFLIDNNYMAVFMEKFDSPYWLLRFLSAALMCIIFIVHLRKINVKKISEILSNLKFICVIFIIALAIFQLVTGNVENFYEFTLEFDSRLYKFGWIIIYILWSYDGVYKNSVLNLNSRCTTFYNFNDLPILLLFANLAYILFNASCIVILGIDGIILSRSILNDIALICLGKYNLSINFFVSISLLDRILNDESNAELQSHHDCKDFLDNKLIIFLIKQLMALISCIIVIIILSVNYPIHFLAAIISMPLNIAVNFLLFEQDKYKAHISRIHSILSDLTKEYFNSNKNALFARFVLSFRDIISYGTFSATENVELKKTIKYCDFCLVS